MKKLQKDFYMRTSLEVARDLLGKYLVVRHGTDFLTVKIIETESYMGIGDKAAHSYNGRRTKRTEVMFGEGGLSYVYLIYGMYNCINVVCNAIDIPQAVLIRSAEPVENIGIMCRNRFGKPLSELKDRRQLTNGPGKLCKALNITGMHNGMSFLSDQLFITDGSPVLDEQVVTTTRIGIDYAEEARDFPYRFYIKDNPYVSRK